MDNLQQPQQPIVPKKPIISTWLLVTFITILLATGGYLGYRAYQNKKGKATTQQGNSTYPSSSSSTASTNTTTPSATSSSSNNQTNKRLVSLNEIGCKGENIFVLSTVSGKIPIDKDGNYTASFSPIGAQLVMLNNSQNTLLCAEAISLPKYQGKVFFNAKSTAKASVFSTLGVLTTDPTEAEWRLTMIENLTSFPALYSYVQTNLPKSNLGGLKTDANYNSLLENSVTEMLKKLGK